MRVQASWVSISKKIMITTTAKCFSPIKARDETQHEPPTIRKTYTKVLITVISVYAKGSKA